MTALAGGGHGCRRRIGRAELQSEGERLSGSGTSPSVAEGRRRQRSVRPSLRRTWARLSPLRVPSAGRCRRADPAKGRRGRALRPGPSPVRPKARRFRGERAVARSAPPAGTVTATKRQGANRTHSPCAGRTAAGRHAAPHGAGAPENEARSLAATVRRPRSTATGGQGRPDEGFDRQTLRPKTERGRASRAGPSPVRPKARRFRGERAVARSAPPVGTPPAPQRPSADRTLSPRGGRTGRRGRNGCSPSARLSRGRAHRRRTALKRSRLCESVALAGSPQPRPRAQAPSHPAAVRPIGSLLPPPHRPGLRRRIGLKAARRRRRRTDPAPRKAMGPGLTARPRRLEAFRIRANRGPGCRTPPAERTTRGSEPAAGWSCRPGPRS